MSEFAASMTTRQRTGVVAAAVLVAAALLGVFGLYLRPDFMLELASRWSLC